MTGRLPNYTLNRYTETHTHTRTDSQRQIDAADQPVGEEDNPPVNSRNDQPYIAVNPSIPAAARDGASRCAENVRRLMDFKKTLKKCK